MSQPSPSAAAPASTCPCARVCDALRLARRTLSRALFVFADALGPVTLLVPLAPMGAAFLVIWMTLTIAACALAPRVGAPEL